jgi:large subunit ribosomal protein L6
MTPPDGISFEVDQKTRQIKVLGYDREAVGQTAAEIRRVRPPEPYHGKGIRYLGEKVRRKAGKAGKGAK